MLFAWAVDKWFGLNPIQLSPKSTGAKEAEDSDAEEFSTTPTGEEEARIPTMLTCPPAPKKRKPVSKCNHRGAIREFFTPPDLGSVFICPFERAN